MNPTEARFREAVSFFATFAESRWKACHVRTGEMEIFIARDRTTPNPMTDKAPVVVAEQSSALRAPHIGTLVTLAEIGTLLAPGQAYARLELLGETIDLTTEKGGRVASHLLPIGTLAEYDQPLVALH
jgi:acetyl-CoA carboxylase biotin carboxyl carrier protein